VDEPNRPAWKTDELRAIDDSIANLVRQMLLAITGMFVAFSLAEWISTRWLDGLAGAGGFVARGLTFTLLGSGAIYLTSARPIRSALAAQQRAIEAHEQSLKDQSEQHALTGRLQAAFEMAESDHDAFEVVARALDTVAQGPAELLLADSSRAHLRRVAVSPADGGPGCGVDTPWSCPAVRRSRTMVFEHSDDLDACPHLRARSGGACSAMCVPVTVLGTPMGVLHSVGPEGERPTARARSEVEAVAEQAGSRIGVLRAMAASELQATTDPLTGLLNRRSLEAEMASLRDRHADYAVAFIDLDHFKSLNDTHGHETGDRALRSFARLLRRAVRDGDLVCRYGGEEFVVVFPDATVADAEPVVARVVEALAAAVRTGDVPAFTISVGLADALAGGSHAEVIRDADEAMFRAKQAGRDRVVVASDPARSVPSDTAESSDDSRQPLRAVTPSAGT
jgi:diguanylate cyclase (GGDEF)-like protein